MKTEFASLAAWTSQPLGEDVTTALNRLRRSEDVREVAVMPDVHLAGDVCIGTVMATSRLLYPNAVGGDIGCGMLAVGFDGPASQIRDRKVAGRLLAGLEECVPILKRKRRPESLPAIFAGRLSDASLEKAKARDGTYQLGTLGRGNHFVELQSDEQGALWLMVHSGSRSLGQRIRDFHLQRGRRSSTGLRLLDAESAEGQAYLQDVNWARGYADANRRQVAVDTAWVVEAVTGAKLDWASAISCDHNHVVPCEDRGARLWVHRKGAISAMDGEPGIIPGSMGDPSFHVSGRGVRAALWSSSHGAGRAMSRSDARRRLSVKDLEAQTKEVWFDRRKARRLIDEAPAAYKDIGAVMRAQNELTRIVRQLTPVLSFKGT